MNAQIPTSVANLARDIGDLTETTESRAAGVALLQGLQNAVGHVMAGIYEFEGHGGGLRVRPLIQSIGKRVQPMEPSDRLCLPASISERFRPALAGAPVLQTPGDVAACCYLFPLPEGKDARTVLMLERDTPLRDTDESIVRQFGRIYQNHVQGLDRCYRDALTGLFNRRTFDANLSSRGRSPDQEAFRWIAVLDIDHFKQVNDRHGHLIGDEVLLRMARLLQAGVREQDHVYRFGGEEFVVVLEQVPVDHAGEIMERIRRTVAQHEFPRVGAVTASLGYAVLSSGRTPLDTLRCADEAMYYAKSHGRNRVCNYDLLLAAGELQHAGAAGEAELF